MSNAYRGGREKIVLAVEMALENKALFRIARLALRQADMMERQYGPLPSDKDMAVTKGPQSIQFLSQSYLEGAEHGLWPPSPFTQFQQLRGRLRKKNTGPRSSRKKIWTQISWFTVPLPNHYIPPSFCSTYLVPIQQSVHKSRSSIL